jgi:predicted RNase H-like HicB family nuclease
MNPKTFALLAFKTATFEEENGTYTAHHDDYPGLFAGGYSLEECIQDFMSAAEQWFIAMRAKDFPIATNRSFNNFNILWSEEDGEFVGVCSEHPYLSHLAKTEQEALAGIKALVGFVEGEI